MPLATLYRWASRPGPRSRAPQRRRVPSWPGGLICAVERLRQDFPMWGKAKLGPLLRANGFAVSDSTTGRILKALVAHDVIQAMPLARRQLRRGLRPKRPHARRLPKGLKAPGDLIQIDTLSVNPVGERTIKQSTDYDPVARFTTARAFRNANSHAAAQFLDHLLDALPFPVRAIQVDGGSEFMAAFATACAARNLQLDVLPPSRPNRTAQSNAPAARGATRATTSRTASTT